MSRSDNITTTSCADFLEILGASISWSAKTLTTHVKGYLYLYLLRYFFLSKKEVWSYTFTNLLYE
jgi:hypothetical protein